MFDYIKKYSLMAFTFIGVVFTFVPDYIIDNINVYGNIQNTGLKTVLIRVTIYFILLLVTVIVALIFLYFRKKVLIKGHNYTIQVQYADLFQLENCKKIITFDECFTTEIGEAPHQIKASSICGQYLSKNCSLDINSLIVSNGIVPSSTKSKYQSKERFESGTIVPNGEYLLMAFAKLDSNGLGHLNRDEYLDCLSLMWKEIDKYYAQNDVCIPIVGSGLTRTGSGSNLTQQELLDLIIYSYQLSNNKINKPKKLIIACCKNDDFSLNKIGQSI